MIAEEIKKAIYILRNEYHTVSQHITHNECVEHNNAISLAIEKLQKEIPYTCKVEDNKFGYHKCKCGVYFVDKHFDGYCGRCGQKIKW